MIFYYESTASTITITGYAGGGGNVIIPATIGGKPVIAIGDRAFAYNQLTGVAIPDSVTSIGKYAFAYNQLTSITIPDKVTAIGYRAFAHNPLTNISVASGNTAYVADNSFFMSKNAPIVLLYYYGSGKDVSIPDGVTSIEDYVFYDKQLTNVTIPNSVISIGSYAFQINQLASLIIPDSVTSIGVCAFQSNKLTSVTIGNGVISIGDGAFSYNRLTSITIGANVTWDDSPFDTDFGGYYIYIYGRAAGTYIWPNTDSTEWTMQ